jgi:CheY-like chemotaxis protein
MAAHVQSHDSLRILIVDDAAAPAVDDHPLRGSGTDVRIATTGAAALDWARAWPPDVLVTELYLLDMTGFQLVAALRANMPEKKALRVVAVTSRSRLQDRLRASEAGFDAFLRKPVSPDVLRRAVGLELP